MFLNEMSLRMEICGGEEGGKRRNNVKTFVEYW